MLTMMIKMVTAEDGAEGRLAKLSESPWTVYLSPPPDLC